MATEDAAAIIARLKKSAAIIALNVDLLETQLEAAAALLNKLEEAIQQERQ